MTCSRVGWQSGESAIPTCTSVLCQPMATFRSSSLDTRNDVRLAVVSADEADQLPLIVGPHERPMLPHGECSVMVVH